MVKDLRYGLRVLLRNPLFTLVAAASLALGIGGAASVFTVLNAVLLRSLPVPNPQQLYVVEKVRPGAEPRWTQYSWPFVQQAREELSAKAELFASTTASGMQVRLTGPVDGPASERALVQLVSGEFFDVLRQQPQAGRLLTPGDNAAGAPAVAVISDAYWARRFDRSREAVGREIVLGGATLAIVGVARPSFFGAFVNVRNPDVWIPLVHQPDVRYASNASSSGRADTRQPWVPQAEIDWLHVFARVRDDADVPAVASALTVLHRRDAESRLEAANSAGRQQLEQEHVVLQPASAGMSHLRSDLSSPLLVLLAMVGVLLAITCGNVATLLLARASARDRELSIRMAIGANRWRVIRQLLAETLLLCAIGGGLGLLVAAWGADALLAMFARNTSIIDLDTSFDWRVVGFSLVITLAAGLGAGLLPAIRSTRLAPTDALKAQARQVGTGGGRRGTLVGRSLVAAQIAFCLLLLVISALFVRTMQSLLDTDIGYDRDQLLVSRMDVRSLGLSNDERQALYTRVTERLRALPGVASASLSLAGPLANSRRTSSLGVEGYTPAEGERLQTNEEVVTDEYFTTVGLRIVQGRGFTPEDRRPGSRSTVINATMARRFFPGGDAIGKRWSYGGQPGPESPVIVGVVEDARYLELRGATPNMVYRLSAAHPDDVLSNMEVRAAGRPEALLATVRQALEQAEPLLPVYDIVPLTERMNRTISNERLVAGLTTTFSAMALLLACLGLYGTISYGVARRVTELGLRMALGAKRGAVLWLVVREALTLVAIGTLLGLPLSYAAARGLTSQLHGVGAIDVPSYAAGIVALTVVATIAASIPAHRASRIDPMVALRAE